MLWKTYLKYIPLPLLVAAYPILFLYGHNASALSLGVLTFPLGATLLVAIPMYALFCLLNQKPLAASLSAVIFIVFFYLYGSIFHLLGKRGGPLEKPFVLLPLVIILAVAIALLIARVKPTLAAGLNRVLLIVSLALVAYNTFGVAVPVEAQKVLSNRSANQVVHPSTVSTQKKPDIYYIIFDEYAGFDAIRSYWQDTSVDQFENFLKQNHFFVATGSRSPTLNTGSEIANGSDWHVCHRSESLLECWCETG